MDGWTDERKNERMNETNNEGTLNKWMKERRNDQTNYQSERNKVNEQGPYAPTGGLDKPQRYHGGKFEKEITRMHRQGLNVARG